MANQELTVLSAQSGGAVVTADHYQDAYFERLKVMKDVIAPGTTDIELAFFSTVCQRRKLDPFTKQIYCVKRKGKKEEDAKLTIQTGIDGFRIIAERTGKYEGQLGPMWCGPDGKWREAWFYKEPPMAAKVAVLRQDFREPMWAVAHYWEYVQTYWNNGEQVPNSMWQKMPAGQLAKCAEALALRKAFPEELSGLYATEEMGQADHEELQDNPQQQRNGRGDRGNAPAGARSMEQTAGGHPTGTTVKSPSSPAPAHGEQVPTGNGGDPKKGVGTPEAPAAGGGPANGKKPAAENTSEQALLADFRNADKYGRLRMFQELKRDLIDVTGDEAEYRRILSQHGVEKSDQFRDLQTAKDCLVALYRFLQNYSNAVSDHPAMADDGSAEDRSDWVPEILNGEVAQ